MESTVLRIEGLRCQETQTCKMGSMQNPEGPSTAIMRTRSFYISVYEYGLDQILLR